MRVGFVIGAEMTAAGLPRRPCETVFTVTGERVGGPSLWYGTDRSLRSLPVTDELRGLFFFFPKNESIVCYEMKGSKLRRARGYRGIGVANVYRND